MIEIITSQLTIFIIWGCFRIYMYKSSHFLFNQSEVHHYDLFTLNIVVPMWFVLGNFFTGFLLLVIFTYISIDDICQHYKSAKLGDLKYTSFLKKITTPLWIWFFEK